MSALFPRPPFETCASCELPRACAGVRHCAKERHAAAEAAVQVLQRTAERITAHNVQLRSFLLRLLDPEDLGHAVTPEVRALARTHVVTPRADSCPPCHGNCRQGRDCPAR